MPAYAVERRNGRVVLPATGANDDLADVSSWYEAEDNLDAFAAAHYAKRKSRKRVRTTAVLVHRADNTYNPNAISVSTPQVDGGTLDERHLGYLRDYFLNRVGMTRLPDLISFGGGELECTVVLEGRDTISVDLPDPGVLGDAIRRFLAGYNIQVSGAPRRKAAPPERHTHRGDSPPTTRTLRLLGTYPADAVPITGVHLATLRYGGVQRRTLRLSDATTGHVLGILDGRWLQLDDERHRDTVLEHLDREGIAADQPVADPSVEEDSTWPSHTPPNVRIRVKARGLDLRIHDPDDRQSQETFAIYNPTRNVLWVEDSRLVSPALRFMHRQGIDVAEVGVPRHSWALDAEIPWQDLGDPDRPWRHDYESSSQPRLLRSLRPLIPRTVLPSGTVDWTTKDTVRADREPTFVLLEKHVQERSTLFPVHTLTAGEARCRLCAGPAVSFTTPIGIEPLAYCQTCLAMAVEGLVEDRDRAGVALRELSRLEFDGQPMLAEQLETLHVNPEEPIDARSIDRLLLLRMGVARKRVAWTLLLEAAGFAEDGLRTGRGTIIRSRDGHLCLSMRERAVCDFLHQHGIQHDREPRYPQDPDYNPNGLRRADWILPDGTLVELWGLPNDPQYAAKMVEKRLLAQRHGLRLVEVFEKDLPTLPAVFEPWLPADMKSSWSWSPLLVATPSAVEKAAQAAKAATPGNNRGRNDFNTAELRERRARCAAAVNLQEAGMSRAEIGQQLIAGPDAVKMLLRDGKFYAHPDNDLDRAWAARLAAEAQEAGLTRAEFQAQAGLTKPKVQEAWRDAAVLHPAASAEPA